MENFEHGYSSRAYGIRYETLKYHSLHHAINDSRITQIRILIKIQPELINFRTNLGLTPLMIACLLPDNEKRLHIIRLLIKAPRLNAYRKDSCKRSVIFYFVQYMSVVDLEEFLRISKFDYFSQTDIDGNSILHYAAVRENLEMLEYLIKLFKHHRINTEMTNSMNYSPLLLACRLCKYKSIALIIKLGECNELKIRDKEFFKTGLEWLQHHSVEDKPIQSDTMFYFNKFQIENDLRFGVSINQFESIAKSSNLKILSARGENSTSKYSDREYSPRRTITGRRIPLIRKLCLEPSIEPKSQLVQEIENMSLEVVKHFVMESLINEKKKQIKPKQVSILLNDIVYVPKRSSISVENFPSCRETSASIAHKLLNKMATYYY